MSKRLKVTRKEEVGRLAIRHEGSLINAYYATPDSMEEPVWLASVHRGGTTATFDAFVALARLRLADLIEDSFGHRPHFSGPQPAHKIEASPEYELEDGGETYAVSRELAAIGRLVGDALNAVVDGTAPPFTLVVWTRDRINYISTIDVDFVADHVDELVASMRRGDPPAHKVS